MDKKLATIYEAFGNKLVGTFPMKMHVCEVIKLLPDDLITYITKNVWFLSSLEDAWAFTFTGNDIKDQHLIFLSDELLMQDESQIHYSIAHEIGHVVLNHRNSVLVSQTAEEIAQQEAEADAFANKYLPH